ncbi:GIN domain-containing protein [Sphingobacterium composti Ten et al. 2007 non Yoo et al. 2007]|uniref:GIN domain-containing protein n=1 Tax=Sphingobacterium composti TaxID=363260 RepID=UPI001359778B|nr:DUF2807 domain-containing protein [Sphingobacterium composti Ten et al. 2007 non Yoo et al. 2007]
MKTVFASILAFLLFSSFQAQHTETRQIGAHQGISVATNLNVSYIESNKNEIVIDCANKNHIALIMTEVENGVLTIQYKPNTKINSLKQNKITVYSNSKLKYLKASSSARLAVDSPISSESVSIVSTSSGKINARHIKAKDLDIQISSSANFDAHIDVSKLMITASSSAKIFLAGKIEDSNIKMSSSAKLDLTQASVRNLVCEGSSSAKLNIMTAQTLSSILSSSANITYEKEPAEILQNKTSSSGKLIKGT